MSRIEEALKRASISPIATEPYALGRERWSVAAKAPARVEDYASEQPTASEPPMRAIPESPSLPSQAESRPPQAEPRVTSSGLLHQPEVFPFQRVSPTVDGKLVSVKGTDPASIEQYRRLATTLYTMQREKGIKVLMVTSSVPREGKTLTSTNLALTLSESYRKRVLLIDGDLRRPFVHELFGIENVDGLGDGFHSHGLPLRVVQVTSTLSAITAGKPQQNPMACLASDRMRTMLKEASGRFDWIILDTPPVGTISDANLLAGLTDGVVFVIGAGSTPYQQVEKAISEIGRDRIIGTVLNRVDHDEVSIGYDPGYYSMSDAS